MGRYRKLKSLEDYSRALKYKYGLGAGSGYKPWIRVQDVPSRGHSGKIYGLKTQREHHMLSENESSLFYLVEFKDSVVDIREQFPLLPLDLSVRISKLIDVEHPKIPKTNNLSVMTTDFLLTCTDGDRFWYEAVSVKPLNELTDKRTLQKLEIERIWWEFINVPFYIFTNDDEHQVISKNIQWITSSVRRGEEINANRLEFILSALEIGTYLIKDVCQEISEATGIPSEQSLNTLKYMLTNKLIIADLTKPMSSTGILDIISLRSPGEGVKHAG